MNWDKLEGGLIVIFVTVLLTLAFWLAGWAVLYLADLVVAIGPGAGDFIQEFTVGLAAYFVFGAPLKDARMLVRELKAPPKDTEPEEALIVNKIPEHTRVIITLPEAITHLPSNKQRKLREMMENDMEQSHIRGMIVPSGTKVAVVGVDPSEKDDEVEP